MTTLNPQPGPPAHPTCSACGYNLATLRPEANCPECGLSVAHSLSVLSPDGLTRFDLRWLKRQRLYYITLQTLFLIMGLAWLAEAVVKWQTVYYGLSSHHIFAERYLIITQTFAVLAPFFFWLNLMHAKPCPDNKHDGIGANYMSILALITGASTLWSIVLVVHALGYLPDPPTGTTLDYSKQINQMTQPIISIAFMLEAGCLAYSSKERNLILKFLLLIPAAILLFIAGYACDYLAGEYIFNQRGPNPMSGADAFAATLSCVSLALLGLFYLLSLLPISLLRREIQSGITHNNSALPAAPANPKA